MENKKIKLFWGSETGTTDGISEMIVEHLSTQFEIEEINMLNASQEMFEDSDHFLFGLSTWYDGQLQIDWDYFFDEFCKLDFTNKTVAIFGLGDQYGYDQYYCDGIGILGEQVIKAGGNLIGWWSTEGYDFSASIAELKDGWFCGLALDEDNQSDLTEERIDKWTKQISNEFNKTFEEKHDKVVITTDL